MDRFYVLKFIQSLFFNEYLLGRGCYLMAFLIWTISAI